MNSTTVRSIIKCGVSLCSKDLFVHPSTSRILYNCTSERNYCSPWSMPSNRKLTSLQPPIGFKQWSINNCIVPFDHQRYFSTSLPHSNSQTALKPKSPDRNDDGEKKPKKGTTKSNTSDKVENQSKGEILTEHAADKTEYVPQIEEEKLTLTAKFKRMYKEYWYVLLPVHVVTSCFWFTGFYYLSTRYVYNCT